MVLSTEALYVTTTRICWGEVRYLGCIEVMTPSTLTARESVGVTNTMVTYCVGLSHRSVVHSPELSALCPLLARQPCLRIESNGQ